MAKVTHKSAAAARQKALRATGRATHSPSHNPAAEHAPLPDVHTQIQQAKEKIIAAVIRKAIDDGSYQHAKWLFEFAAVKPAEDSSGEGEVALARFLLEQLQIPETASANPAEISANDHAVE